MFRDFKKFLVPRHDAIATSENEHAAVGVENRRSRRAIASVQLVECERVARYLHNSVGSGNYNDPILSKTMSNQKLISLHIYIYIHK